MLFGFEFVEDPAVPGIGGKVTPAFVFVFVFEAAPRLLLEVVPLIGAIAESLPKPGEFCWFKILLLLLLLLFLLLLPLVLLLLLLLLVSLPLLKISGLLGNGEFDKFGGGNCWWTC